MKATFIRKTINRLEKRFGRTIVLKNEIERTKDLSTGRILRSFESVELTDCMVQPVTLQRDFAYGLSFLAADKNFTYGGKFDKGVLQVSVLRDRLPTGFEVDLRTLVVIGTKTHVIKLIENDQTDGQYYHRLIVVETESADLGNIVIRGKVASFEVTCVNPTVTIV